VGAALGSISLLLGYYYAKEYTRFIGQGSIFAQAPRIYLVEITKFATAALIMAVNGHSGHSMIQQLLIAAGTATKTTAIKGTLDIGVVELDNKLRNEENAEVLDVLRDISFATISISEVSLATAEMAGWAPARVLLLGMAAMGGLSLIASKGWYKNMIPNVFIESCARLLRSK
jgi:hypothetical protein